MSLQCAVGCFVAGLVVVGAAQEPTVPDDFRGAWASSRTRCGTVHEGSLSITARRVDFYESRGSVLAVRLISPLEVELDLELTGEGESRRSVRRFVLSKDKSTLTDITNSRYPFSRVRCG
jgi:hypothetical protein